MITIPSTTALLVLALTMVAHAGKPPPSGPAPDPSSSADAAASAGAASIAGAGAASHIGDVAGGESVATVGDLAASNEGVRAGSSYRHRTDVDALSLSLPGLPGAPAVGGHKCLEHSPVTSIFGAGRGGKTELNDECMRREHCKELADRYAQWGRIDLAIRQLAMCDGVDDPGAVAWPSAPGAQCEDGRLREEVIACRQREAGFGDQDK